MTITVTWIDARQETYHCKDWVVENGLLWLHPSPPGVAGPGPVRCIPLARVRIWTVG